MEVMARIDNRIFMSFYVEITFQSFYIILKGFQASGGDTAERAGFLALRGLLHLDVTNRLTVKKPSDRHTTEKPRGIRFHRGSHLKRRRPPTLPHCIAVPSAQAGLTSLFGMGRGGTPLQ